MNIFKFVLDWYRKHLVYILPVVAFIVLATLMTQIIPTNKVYMHFEHEFSFEYKYHLQVALNEIKYGDFFQTDLTRCINCEGYTDYNRWHYLFKSFILSIPEILGFHPEAGFWLIQSLPLFLAWIFFIRSFRPEYDWVTLYISALIFTYIPIRMSYLFGSSTLTNLQYAVITSMMAIMIRLPTYRTKRNLYVLMTLILGLIMSLSLNIGLSNVHNTYLIFGCIALFQLIVYKRERLYLFVSYCTAILLVCFVNMPFILSHIQHSIQVAYPNYVSTSWIDGLLLQMVSMGVSPLLIGLFSTCWITGIMLSQHSWKTKTLLFLVYFGAANFVAGQNAVVPLAEWLFRHFPTFTTLRSMYRFNFYQIMIVTYGFCILLHKLQSNRLPTLLTRYVVGIIVLFLISISLHSQLRIHPSFDIPPEYAQVANVLRSLPGDKLYFPPHPHQTVDLLHAYSWSPRQSIEPNLVSFYSNPFKSIYAVPDIYQLYDLAQSPTHQMYRAFLDIERTDRSTVEIVAATKKTPFRFIIVDKNYLWSKLYPHISIETFTSSFHEYKRIGNIIILENTPSNLCSLEDTISQSICHQVRQLTRLERGIASHQILLSKIRAHDYLSFIMVPQERLRLRTANIITSTYMKVISGDQRDVFDFSSIKRSNLTGTIVIPLLVNEGADNQASGITIKHNTDSPLNISTFSAEETHTSYISIPFVSGKGSHISIDTFGDRPVTFIANPFFIPLNTPGFK